MMYRRRVILSIFLMVSTFFYIEFFSEMRRVPARRELKDFPVRIAEWIAKRDNHLNEENLRILNVSDYLDRDFWRDDGRTINLYISYFDRQNQGQMIHSPKHCLPGSGWEEVRYENQWIPLKGMENDGISINKYVVMKESEKYLVLYWYQSRGRIVRGEYLDRIYLIWDAITKHRTDGSLVRIIIKLKSSNGVEDLNAVIDFIQNVMPIIDSYIPS